MPGSRWAESPLGIALAKTGRNSLLICGYWLDECITFTALNALGEGYDIFLLTDASPPLDADELCEGYYRNLMLCHQRRGEPSEALNTFERLRTVLAARLKATPSPETQAVYASLVAPPDIRPAARE